VLIKVVGIDRSGQFADIEITASGMSGSNHGFSGPNAFANGYVLRQADALDYAYVNGFRRDVVQNDNNASPSRSQSTLRDWRIG
jgi:hypothetical protein